VRVLFPIIPRIKKKTKLTFSSSSSSFHTRETFSSRLFLSISLLIFCNPHLSLYYYCNYYYGVRYGYNYIFTYNSLYYV
jgi:hypothetical protein